MKLRKILATVVAGAIAASTMITAASAAETTISRTISNKLTGSYAVFTGKLDTSSLRFDALAVTNSSSTAILTADVSTIATGAFSIPTASSLGGSYYSGYTWVIDSATLNDYNLASALAAGLGDTITSTSGIPLSSLAYASGVIGSVTVTVKAHLAKVGETDGLEKTNDLIEDLGSDLDQSISLDFKQVRVPNAKGEYDLGVLADDIDAPAASNMTTSLGLAVSAEVADEGDKATATYTLEKFSFTTAEKAMLKNAKSAKFEANLKNVSRQDSYAIVTVDDNSKLTASLVSGKASTLTIDVPVDYLYYADYDAFFDDIVLSIIDYGGNATIVDATLTFTVDDGTEVVAPDVTDEDDAEDDFDDDDEEFGDEDIIDNTTDDDDIEDGDDDMDYDDDDTDDTDVETTDVPKTGVALAIVPAAIAAAAVVIARKRK